MILLLFFLLKFLHLPYYSDFYYLCREGKFLKTEKNNVNIESNSEEKIESEMSIKFQRIKEKKERNM